MGSNQLFQQALNRSIWEWTWDWHVGSNCHYRKETKEIYGMSVRCLWTVHGEKHCPLLYLGWVRWCTFPIKLHWHSFLFYQPVPLSLSVSSNFPSWFLTFPIPRISGCNKTPTKQVECHSFCLLQLWLFIELSQPSFPRQYALHLQRKIFEAPISWVFDKHC